MEYLKLSKSESILSFRLSGVDKSFVNALRRTLIGNIPIMVLKPVDCDISINTTRFTNEIIKARLACIPIHSFAMNAIHEKFTVEVSKKNDSPETIYITSEDFTIQSKQNKTIFPAYTLKGLDDTSHNSYIEFMRLRSGEELKLRCTTSVGTANESGMYNAVGTCAYGCTHDEDASERKWDQSPSGTKEDWDLLTAKRSIIPDSFDFILAGIGIYSNEKLLMYSASIIQTQLADCKISLQITPSLTTIQDCFDISITGNYTIDPLVIKLAGDYTIGKLLEYQIYTKFQKPFTYVAYYKKHPHDAVGILRIAFPGADPTSVEQYVSTACDECHALFETFKGLIHLKGKSK